MIWIFMLMFLTGCSTFSHSHKNTYEEGYRQGVREQVAQVVAQFQGGNFPYYHWSSPIVQEVKIPAHLASGVMIPEHKELVIIKPGEWAISGAYPINAKEGENYGNQISYMDIGDLTALPNGLGLTQQGHDAGTKVADHPGRMEEASTH